jgi:hypothetical protein
METVRERGWAGLITLVMLQSNGDRAAGGISGVFTPFLQGFSGFSGNRSTFFVTLVRGF